MHTPMVAPIRPIIARCKFNILPSMKYKLLFWFHGKTEQAPNRFQPKSICITGINNMHTLHAARRTLHEKGFTLVELLVAILLVSIIMTIGASVFVQALDLQRRAFNIQQAEENASFVLEAMAKEIRVGVVTVPVSDSDCPATPSATLTITHPVNGTVSYSLVDTDIHRIVNGVDTVMNSNSVQFVRLSFCVTGVGVGDSKQPRITVIASVRSTATKQQITADIQTTISQRALSD